jgi:hypothetical protein
MQKKLCKPYLQKKEMAEFCWISITTYDLINYGVIK